MFEYCAGVILTVFLRSDSMIQKLIEYGLRAGVLNWWIVLRSLEESFLIVCAGSFR